MNIGIEIDGVLCNMKKLKRHNLMKFIFNPARRYASWAIRRLHNEGNKIIIITSRKHVKRFDLIGVLTRFITINWLNRHRIYYDEVIFCSEKKNGTSKKSACEKHAIDVMIEDKNEDILELSQEIKIICFYSNHNREIEGKNIVRVNTFKDIYSYMNYHDWEVF